ALAGALEAGDAGRAPADHGTVEVGDRDDRVVEGGLDMYVPLGDVLALASALFGRLLAFRHALVSPSSLLAPDADRLLRSASLARGGLGAQAAALVRSRCRRMFVVGPLSRPGRVGPWASDAARADLDETLYVQRRLAT